MNASARVLFGGLAVGAGVAAAVWLVPAVAFAAPSPQNHGAVTPGTAHSTHHVAPSASSASVTPVASSTASGGSGTSRLEKVQAQEAQLAAQAAQTKTAEEARLSKDQAQLDSSKATLKTAIEASLSASSVWVQAVTAHQSIVNGLGFALTADADAAQAKLATAGSKMRMSYYTEQAKLVDAAFSEALRIKQIQEAYLQNAVSHNPQSPPNFVP